MAAAASAERLRGGFDVGVLGQFIHGDQRADAHTGGGLLDAFQLLDVLDVHDALGRVQVLLHQAEEVRAAGQHIGLAPLGGEQPHRFLNGCRIGVFKGLHYAFLPSSVLSTCIGVIGILGTRMPIALATALPTAAQMPTGRRFAETDDAALVVVLADIHVHDDVADILDAGELIELHIGVHHAAGGVVHNALFEERGGDAHDDGAVDLAFGQPRIDDQAAILHGHEAVHLDQAGFGIDADVGHLHAGRAAAD